MRRWLRRLVLAGGSLLLLTSVGVIAASLAMQQRHGGGRSVAEPVDAAIVLGSGVDPDMILNYSTRRRVAAGVALARAGLAGRLIMSGGKVRSGNISAAGLMRDYAVSLGMPPEALLVEAGSDTTFENIRFSLAVAGEAGLDRLALVTDDYHLLRASWLACYFGDCTIDMVAVPVIDSAPMPDAVRDIGRESLAWWYNLGKVALWSALGGIGIPEARRERFIQ